MLVFISFIEQFIDRNRTKLISRVSNVDAILDELLQMRVITDENYSTIFAERTSQEKMRKLFMGPIKSAGARGKDALYKALKEVEPILTEELESQWKSLDIFTFNVFLFTCLISIQDR